MKILIFLFFMVGCNPDSNTQSSSAQSETGTNQLSLIHPEGSWVSSRIVLPPGYFRTRAESNSFGNYLRLLPLKAHGTEVFLYDGSRKQNQAAHVAVIDVSVGNTDLQQCADAVIRLRADYLKKSGRFDEISFNFTNGFKADYKKWRMGNGIRVQSSYSSWVPSSQANQTEESYHHYLNKVFSYAGSLSLSRQLLNVSNLADIQMGDVWIRGGSPGHAAIVIDVAKNQKGNLIFLLAQSYMPAQDIHILKNPNNNDLSPWYSIDDILKELKTPEYTFNSTELKRFK